MKLTKRLIAANTIVVIVPLVITTIVALAMIFIFGKLSPSNLTLENYQRLAEIQLELTGSQDSILKKNPEIIEDPLFQQQLFDQLSVIDGKLIILKNDHILFSSDNFTKIDVAKSKEIAKKVRDKDPFTFNNHHYAIQMIELGLKDGSLGEILLLTPIDSSEENLKGFLLLLTILFFLTFILTAFFVSFQFSRTIVTPLNNLQKAAAEITHGNLDFQIVEEGDHEIQALCRDLEQMRIKLKESIYIQLKYEDNRKMLISSISHDLKTPVTTIKGYVEGILDGITQTPEKTEKYLKTIYHKAQQMDHLIDDLLLYAKLDLNQIPYHFVKTDIEDYLKTCIADGDFDLENKTIKITYESSLSQKQIVPIDRERLKRVLINILDNSQKYIDKEQGEIHILLRETHLSLVLEIRDNGSGISDMDLPHIFDRFYRSDLARSDIKGSGLGLAIAKQIIEGHHGKIWAINHDSGGTRILISLPKS